MDIRPQPEELPDVPEADALEQRMPVLPERVEDFGGTDPLPEDAPEADVIEQRTEVQPGSAGYSEIPRAIEVEAAEADLVEQAVAPSVNDEEDFPDAYEEIP